MRNDRFGNATVLLVDDHALFRHALRSVIDAEPGLEVLAEAEDGQEALAEMRREPADLVITDAVMPVLNGLELVPKLLAEFPRTRVLIVSGHAQADHVRRGLENGAAGFVTKSSGVGTLLEAIDAVLRDRSYLSPCVADVVVQSCVRRNGAARGGNGHPHDAEANGRRSGVTPRSLTAREREVLQMLSEGFATKAIAAELSVSVKTIDTHRAALMRKLDLKSVAHLTKYAVREGLTTLDY